MQKWAVVCGFVPSLFLAVSLNAQVGETASSTPLEAGVQSLEFGVGGGGTGSFGYWRMRSSHLNVGWEVGFGAQHSSATFRTPVGNEESASATGFSVEAGPRFRRYLDVSHRVAPFVQSGISVGYGYQRQDTDARPPVNGHQSSVSASLGVGAEWFPLQRVSLAGHTGIGGGVVYQRMEAPAGRQSGWGVGVGTFTTGLSGRIYLMPGSVLGL